MINLFRQATLSRSLAVAVCLLFAAGAYAQTVPVGSFGDEVIRRLQLEGKIGIEHSLGARPFCTTESLTTDSIYVLSGNGKSFSVKRKTFSGGSIEFLPVTFTSRFNSDHPYGWNEAGLIQAKGLQGKITTGVFVEKGIFSVQFKPEFAFASNPAFAYNNLYGTANTTSYSKMFLGQSSLRINKWALSLGVSTENLWWGPGIYNSLLMSNNAPGFAHITFNTRRPLKTWIGNFEWQLVMGKLVEDPNVLQELKNLTTTYYNPLSYDGTGSSGPYDYKQKWRYLSGLRLSYNPKWVKGLFFGLNRVGYAYNDKLQSSGFDFLHKYFPVLFGAFRQNYAYGTDYTNLPIGYKQIASVDFRFVFPKSHAEVYGEYGVDDNSYNIRDLTLDPQHSAAYTLGLKKLKELPHGKWLDLTYELTHMAEQVDYIIRTSGNWYQFQGGYTNQNRIIGAGVGSGNNVQTIRLTHINGFNKVGMIIQGITHDPTAIISTLNTLGIRDTKWKDLSLGLMAEYHYKQFLLSADIQFVNTKNYAWEDGNNRSNFYGLLNFSYLW